MHKTSQMNSLITFLTVGPTWFVASRIVPTLSYPRPGGQTITNVTSHQKYVLLNSTYNLLLELEEFKAWILLEKDQK